MDLLTPEFGLIFWHTIIFLVLLFLLGKFAWKPILKALNDREHSIEAALRSADKAREEMESLRADNQKLLAEAKEEREKVLKDAARVASGIKEEAKEEASKISNKMIADAKAAIDTEKEKALSEIKDQVAELSLQISEKLLRKQLDDQGEQKELIRDFMKDIKLN
jgi:F-type H+-transporting ATPase subunit b